MKNSTLPEILDPDSPISAVRPQSICLISGEPGAGKSILLEQCIQEWEKCKHRCAVLPLEKCANTSVESVLNWIKKCDQNQARFICVDPITIMDGYDQINYCEFVRIINRVLLLSHASVVLTAHPLGRDGDIRIQALVRYTHAVLSMTSHKPHQMRLAHAQGQGKFVTVTHSIHVIKNRFGPSDTAYGMLFDTEALRFKTCGELEVTND